MKRSTARAREMVPFALTLFLLLISGKVLAQFQLRSDGFSALGGAAAATGTNLLATGGQPHPIGASSNANFILNPGIIPGLAKISVQCNPSDCTGPAVFPTPKDGAQDQPISGRNGGEVFIDIRLKQNPQPVGSFGLKVQVDPAKLKFAGAERGDLTPAPGFVAVNAQETPPGSGTINCGGFGTTPIPPNSAGVLIRLRFTVVCTEGDRSEITITGLSDGLAGFKGCCNIFTCAACVSNGDVNNDGVLTPNDALCAFNIFLGGGTLPAQCDVPGFDCEHVRADVNCDGSVTPNDALAIFQRFLSGQSPAECFGKSALGKANLSSEPYALSLQQRLVTQPGNAPHQKMVKVSLRVEQPQGLDAFGLRLAFPADKLAFIGIERTALTAGWAQLDGRVNEAGVVTIGGYTAEPVTVTAADDPLFHVLFAVKAQFHSASFATSDYGFEVSQLVDGLRQATMKSGGSDQQGVAAAVPTAFKLHQSYPNPFQARAPELATVIRFDLPGSEALKVELSIYNITGQLVRHLISEARSPGAYATAWDGKDERGQLVPSGFYLYRLKAGNFVATKRLTLVR